MNPVSLAQSFLADIAAGMAGGDEMRSRARLLVGELESVRLPPHLTPDEREEIEALRDFDFAGLPREALVASIHYLAGLLLGGNPLAPPAARSLEPWPPAT